ncbi:hypothetical protein TNCV_946851 [Trichonephila clavipes]|nr:hypothetical protein TNCV_946851 [Trichonephila clavipes]
MMSSIFGFRDLNSRHLVTYRWSLWFNTGVPITSRIFEEDGSRVADWCFTVADLVHSRKLVSPFGAAPYRRIPIAASNRDGAVFQQRCCVIVFPIMRGSYVYDRSERGTCEVEFESRVGAAVAQWSRYRISAEFVLGVSQALPPPQWGVRYRTTRFPNLHIMAAVSEWSWPVLLSYGFETWYH